MLHHLTSRRKSHLLALTILVTCLAWTSLIPAAKADPSNPDDALFAEGKAAVEEYLRTHAMLMSEGSDEYEAFLTAVLNDQYPELTSKGDVDPVGHYVTSVLNLQTDVETPTVQWAQVFLPLLNGSASTGTSDTTVVVTPKTTQTPELSLWVGYDRWAARNYTYQWTAWWGGKSRNPAYPDFPSNDCSNFMSQALRAGGIQMTGSGICRDEPTTSEWYVTKRSSLCGLWGQSLRDWNWSTSWSTVRDFRYYVRDRLGAYVEAYPANNQAVSLLISRAREGDIIQFDKRDCSTCAWVPAHAVMVSTRTNVGSYYANDLTYNDHSGNGTNLNDSRDASLRGKYGEWSRLGLTHLRRMVWIKM